MLDLRAPGGGQLTPDGKTLFFTWRVTGTDQVWRVDGPNSFPRQMTGGEDRTTLAAITRDGRWLVLQRDRKGEENPGLYLQPVDGGAVIEIQHKPRVQSEFQAFSADGGALYYVANDQRADSYALYRTDLATRQTQRVLGEPDDASPKLPGFWRLAETRVIDGEERALLVRVVGSRQTEWYEYGLRGKALKPLLGQGERQSYRMRFGVRDGEYFVATDRFEDLTRLYRWHSAQGTQAAAFERIAVGGSAQLGGLSGESVRHTQQLADL